MAAFTNTVMLADTTDIDGYTGAGVDVGFTETMADLQGVYAEAYLCNLIKYDAVTNWASLNAVYKLIMSEYVARSIAMTAIAYQTAGYTDRIEAEDMISLHLFRLNEIENLLSKADVQDFMGV